jgi:hypothetical protein
MIEGSHFPLGAHKPVAHGRGGIKKGRDHGPALLMRHCGGAFT